MCLTWTAVHKPWAIADEGRGTSQYVFIRGTMRTKFLTGGQGQGYRGGAGWVAASCDTGLWKEETAWGAQHASSCSYYGTLDGISSVIPSSSP